MCSGERPMGAAKGKYTTTMASCQPPPPRALQASAGRALPPPGGGALVGTGAPTRSTQAPRGAGRVWKLGALPGCGSPMKA